MDRRFLPFREKKILFQNVRMRAAAYALRYSSHDTCTKLYSGSLNVAHQPFIESDEITIFVWNIFKQKRERALDMLKRYAKNSQLMLLQEAHTTPELLNDALECYPIVDHVPVLSIAGYTSGVMTLSAMPPSYCCPLQIQEPLIRLYKSALITVYPLLNGKQLLIANVHAINFSLGLIGYRRQLDEIIRLVHNHKGPVILAGDFNSWNKRRVSALNNLSEMIKLRPVKFNNDIRKKILGKPLDFVFYRDMRVVTSQIIATSSSDHNPMQVTFSLLP